MEAGTKEGGDKIFSKQASGSMHAFYRDVDTQKTWKGGKWRGEMILQTLKQQKQVDMPDSTMPPTRYVTFENFIYPEVPMQQTWLCQRYSGRYPSTSGLTYPVYLATHQRYFCLFEISAV